jgi:hypothetical protein
MNKYIEEFKASQSFSEEEKKKVFEEIQQLWIKELDNPKSIFYKDKFIEKEFKKICSRAGNTTLKIIKAIKFSLLEKQKCYYSQRDLAKHFKVNLKTVKQSIDLIEKTLNTKFIFLPKETINNNISNKSRGRFILLPPIFFQKFIFLCQQYFDDGSSGFDDGSLKNKSNKINGIEKFDDGSLTKFLNNSLNLQVIPIYLYNLYNYNTSIFLSLFKVLRTLKEERKYTIGKSSLTSLNNLPSFFENKENPLKLKLKVKPKRVTLNIKQKPTVIVNMNDYGIHARQFQDHVELHRTLYNWVEELIENNIEPKTEETIEFLKAWDIFGNKRFVKHRPNPTSATFKFIRIALTYRLWTQQIDVSKTIEAIKRFSELSEIKGTLYFCKKLTILNHFLWNNPVYCHRDFFRISLIETKSAAVAEYYAQKDVIYTRSLEKIRELFVKVFYPDKEEMGNKIFYDNYHRFTTFTKEMVEDHKTKELVKFSGGGLEGLAQYVHTYFDYVKHSTKFTENTYFRSLSHILGISKKGEFILWTSQRKGWEDFYKEKSE